MNDVTARGENSTLSRNRPSGITSRAAGDQRNGAPVRAAGWMEWYREPAPGRPPQATSWSQAVDETRPDLPSQHRRNALGPEVFRAHSGAARDRTVTMPPPQLVHGLAGDRARGDTALGMDALLSLSTVVRDVPAPVEPPRPRRPVADSGHRRRAVPAAAQPSGPRSRKVLAM